MAIFSNPLFATYSVYARNASTNQYTLFFAGLYLPQPVALLGFNDRFPGLSTTSF